MTAVRTRLIVLGCNVVSREIGGTLSTSHSVYMQLAINIDTVKAKRVCHAGANSNVHAEQRHLGISLALYLYVLFSVKMYSNLIV